ncbi:MAG: acyl-CoA dehydrogenase family protein [Pseudomonadota bacterium]
MPQAFEHILDLPRETQALRQQVREFIATEMADVSSLERARNWTAVNPGFSRRLGAQGWIGMTWPRAYGGAERSFLERYVVMEELLAAGAPVAAHWIADRQSGPLLMRYAPHLAERIVPGIVRGETYFCIGMSEPDSGSDLASVRTSARQVEGGWIINGTKLWTSFAQHAHYMIALVRTSDGPKDRQKGLSQFLVDMKNPAVHVSPIRNIVGDDDFNTVILDECFVPDECLIGQPGDGWQQVTSELAFERSGPERYLSSTQVFVEMLDTADATDRRQAIEIGKLVADYASLRQMSINVAGLLARQEDAALAATLVKDQGALLEQRIPEVAHALLSDREFAPGSSLSELIDFSVQASVSYSLRGGTREILRGIIARGLGLR